VTYGGRKKRKVRSKAPRKKTTHRKSEPERLGGGYTKEENEPEGNEPKKRKRWRKSGGRNQENN